MMVILLMIRITPDFKSRRRRRYRRCFIQCIHQKKKQRKNHNENIRKKNIKKNFISKNHTNTTHRQKHIFQAGFYIQIDFTFRIIFNWLELNMNIKNIYICVFFCLVYNNNHDSVYNDQEFFFFSFTKYVSIHITYTHIYI